MRRLSVGGSNVLRTCSVSGWQNRGGAAVYALPDFGGSKEEADGGIVVAQNQRLTVRLTVAG